MASTAVMPQSQPQPATMNTTAAESANSSANANNAADPVVHPIFEPVTGTWQYLVADPNSKHAVIIDSVLDFDPASATISTSSADKILSLIRERGYSVTYILETHAHADHLTASRYLQHALSTSSSNPIPICIGSGIRQVQSVLAPRYAIPDSELSSAFSHLLEPDTKFPIHSSSSLDIHTMHLPGHTPDHMGYMIGPNVFTGDSIFNPDLGSARCDFPGGSARSLYSSTQRLLSLPPHYNLYTGHDYPPAPGSSEEKKREPRASFTVQEHRDSNKHVGEGKAEHEFVQMREERDGKLGEPRLLHQSLQVNLRGGRLPQPFSIKGEGDVFGEEQEEGDSLVMLKVPVKGVDKVKGLL